MFGRLFGKTYRHRCSDGSEKIVYRNVDDAFPFHVPGWKAQLDSNLKIPVSGSGGVKGGFETKIQGLLVGLDSLNQGIMMNFRGAYVAYQSDPCAGHEFLLREISRILQEQQRLQRLKLQIEGLIALAKTCKDQTQFAKLYQDIVSQIGGVSVAEAAAVEIHQTAIDAKKWIGDNRGV